MPASTRELPPINLRLPNANVVMDDIPLESPASPSSLDVDHELTVRPLFVSFCPSANYPSLKSESFITLTRAKRSLYVRAPQISRRSVRLPPFLVRSR